MLNYISCLVSLFLMLPSMVLACSCAPVDLSQRVEQASQIYLVEIVDLKNEKTVSTHSRLMQRKAHWITAKAEVFEQKRGSLTEVFLKTQLGSPASCGMGERFKIGDKYLLILSKEGEKQDVSLCSGIYSLNNDDLIINKLDSILSK